MSAVNITDTTVDSVVTAISTSISDYFDEMEETGFSMTAPRVVKKGLPTPIKMLWPSIYVRPSKTTQIDRYAYAIEIDISYYVKDQDTGRLAKTIARGADAIGQLIRDRFSVQRLDYAFEYAIPESHPEAVASLTVEIIA